MTRHQKRNQQPLMTVIIMLHSMSEKDFEVDDIIFPDKKYDKLTKEYARLNGDPSHEKELKTICNQLCDIDNLRDMVAEDVGDYGDVSSNINRELWEENQVERDYIIKISLWYTTTQDYFGEVDVDVDFEYEVMNPMPKGRGLK